MNKSKTVTIKISTLSIIKVILVVAGTYIAYRFIAKIDDVILALFLGYIISVSLRPSVLWLEKKKFSKDLAIYLTHFGFALALVGTFAFILVPVSNQLSGFLQGGKLNEYIDILATRYEFIRHDLNNFLNFVPNYQLPSIENLINIESLLQSGFDIANNVASFLFLLVMVFLFSIYISLSYEQILIRGLKFIPKVKTRKSVNDMITHINTHLGHWIQSKLILSGIIFIGTLVFLTALGLPLKLPLALIAGILEVVPNIGPTLATFPALFVALAAGNNYQVIAVLIGYILIQQIENYLLVPRIMSKSVGLPAFAVVLCLIIGAKLMGPIGAIISIPVVAILKIVIDHYFEHMKETKSA